MCAFDKLKVNILQIKKKQHSKLMVYNDVNVMRLKRSDIYEYNSCNNS